MKNIFKHLGIFKKEGKNDLDPPNIRPRKDYTPKVYVLKKEMPSLQIGARFQQSFSSTNIYFHAIPISSLKPEIDQVGMIEIEARYVENNPEWFELQTREI